MTARSQSRRLSIVVSVATLVLVVAACTIELRNQEQISSSAAPAAEQADPLAAELARCRTVTLEQTEALAKCRQIWAERRRQFLKQKTAPTPTLTPTAVPNGNAAEVNSRKDESRVPQGGPSVSTGQGE
ncbi:hypothetical protein I8G32_04253 [Rhodopseudomonas palustris]|uniref:Entry exclusion protein TrbK-alt n=1 Tax=Rhodopseudomonas palustris (strain ATCC BAA-98 / CGA009) TaxID=258594 RepID=Q6N2D1_RHOPA|nr:putative entry exclusion protein TrbK-alt [Rhodopseudomonas palustris]OPF92479.1 conjugal transfer protein TrbK [Rhodopseudomonas palustris]QQM05683.1 hypothetical protein I8G32_04253 [Rhodopseudomonas palustris]RJF63906.1 conjugal transfer protein TrbK [Rhodopseudomonas palustris]WAB77010.1 putative entry exclusion protein TrbK-alt [Rhodopseudomonas palustris]WCL94307.1 putative entry exclusion protein TrbK-alt [Rhodopseudomonas palustris CGA009]